MVSKKKGGLLCAVLALLAGTAFDIMILNPVTDTFIENTSCPTQQKWLDICLNLKSTLFLVPYLSSFFGIFVFLTKVKIIE